MTSRFAKADPAPPPPRCFASAPRSLIRFRLPLQALLYLLCFCPVAISVSLFGLYYLEGRFCGYIPTISETIAEDPNIRFSGGVFSYLAVVVFYTGMVLYWYFSSFYDISFFWRSFLIWTDIFGSAGLVLLASFPLNGAYSKVHFFWAIMALGNLNAYQYGLLIVAWKRATQKENIVRILIVFGEMIGLLLTALSDKIGTNRQIETISAIGEYTFLLLVPVFLVSFAGQLAKVDQYLVLGLAK
jgi:hypothetical protein